MTGDGGIVWEDDGHRGGAYGWVPTVGGVKRL